MHKTTQIDPDLKEFLFLEARQRRHWIALKLSQLMLKHLYLLSSNKLSLGQHIVTGLSCPGDYNRLVGDVYNKFGFAVLTLIDFISLPDYFQAFSYQLLTALEHGGSELE